MKLRLDFGTLGQRKSNLHQIDIYLTGEGMANSERSSTDMQRLLKFGLGRQKPTLLKQHPGQAPPKPSQSQERIIQSDGPRLNECLTRFDRTPRYHLSIRKRSTLGK